MSDITKIFDIMKSTCRYDGIRHTGDFGVEIETEVESSRAYDFPRMKYWSVKRDGSLRDYGAEYVLKAPANSSELQNALNEFKTVCSKFNFKKDSISTSVHIHLNMLNDTYLTLANFITTYSLMENLLIRYSGPDRISNLFCLPMIDAEGIVTHIEDLLSKINKKMFTRLSMSPERVKYSALNMANLTTLGTAEVRTFRGETDIDIIFKWSQILLKMKEFSRRDNLTPPDIVLLYKDIGAEALVDLVFQEYSSEVKIFGKTKELIDSNIKYAAKFASVSKNWKQFGILKQKTVYREKVKSTLDKMSVDKFGSQYDQLPYHEKLVVDELYYINNLSTRIVDSTEDI